MLLKHVACALQLTCLAYLLSKALLGSARVCSTRCHSVSINVLHTNTTLPQALAVLGQLA